MIYGIAIPTLTFITISSLVPDNNPESMD